MVTHELEEAMTVEIGTHCRDTIVLHLQTFLLEEVFYLFIPVIFL